MQDEEKELYQDIAEPSKLRAALRLACIASFALTIIMDFLIPMLMFFSHYIFNKGSSQHAQ
jgi:hypothetical protein